MGQENLKVKTKSDLHSKQTHYEENNNIPRIENYIKYKESFEELWKSIISNALVPNGYFPPEVIEMIFRYTEDPVDQIRAALSCKIWLISASNIFKQSNLFSKSLSKANFGAKLYWIDVLMNGVRFHRPQYLKSDWTLHGNLLVLNKYWAYQRHPGLPTDTYRTSATLFDLTRTRPPEEISYGTHLIGGIKVIPRAVYHHYVIWDWSTVQCVVDEHTTITIETKYKYVPQRRAGEWHVGLEERYTMGLPNLDGSATLLLYDCCRKFVTVTFHVEVYDVTNGELLFDRSIKANEILGFYNDMAICSIISKKKETAQIIDLKTGNVVHEINGTQFHIYGNKIAFVRADNCVAIYSFKEFKLLREVNLRTIIPLDDSKEEERMVIAFDHWKLVVCNSTLRKSSIYILDMINNFKLVQVIPVPVTQIWNQKAKLGLPATGSILFSKDFGPLLEINCFHPVLERGTINVAVHHKGSKKFHIKSVSPLDLVRFIEDEFQPGPQKIKLQELAYVTYYMPLNTNEDQKEYEPYKRYLDLKNVKVFKPDHLYSGHRITFVFAVLADEPEHEELAWLDGLQTHWDLRWEHSSTLLLAHDHVGITPGIPYDQIQENFILIYEKYDETRHCWVMEEPYAVAGLKQFSFPWKSVTKKKDKD